MAQGRGGLYPELAELPSSGATEEDQRILSRRRLPREQHVEQRSLCRLTPRSRSCCCSQSCSNWKELTC